ncbi:MAG: hypothetical protein ACFFG0_37000 [Candidatus Thorarchaeota archaeon]
MSDKNRVILEIKEELQNERPNSKRILKSLFDLKTKEKFQSLYDSKFFDIIGDTFNLNPNFFMKELYQTFRNKMAKIIGVKDLMDMEKKIIEKFSLYEGEQILYECEGNIKVTEVIVKESGKFTSQPLNISVSSGNLFFTKYRIIAHGKLEVSGGQKWITVMGEDIPLVTDITFVFSGRSRRAESKKKIIEDSIYQELPCYGYQFPIKHLTKLRLNNLSYSVTYYLRIDNRKCVFTIKPLRSSKKDKSIILINNIFEILSKETN